jgi:hypothetical protein
MLSVEWRRPRIHRRAARSRLLQTMDDDAIILALIAVLTAVTHATCAQGSQPKLRRTKAQNRNRNRRAEATRLKKMYFAPNLHSDIANTVAVSIRRPTFDKKEFARRFGIDMQI